MTNLISAIPYIEDLIEMLSEIKQINEFKNIFYEIIVNFMEIMNEEGLSKKKNKRYDRYYGKLYFEREFYVCKKYITEEDIENMDKNIRERYQKQKLIDVEELKKVNSFTTFIEQKIKSGKFMYGKTGFTVIGKKIEKFEKDMDTMEVEEVKEILDIFESMVDSFDEKDNSIGEAYCLCHIIVISDKFFKRGYEKDDR